MAARPVEWPEGRRALRSCDQRPDRLEKVLTLFRCGTTHCAFEGWQLNSLRIVVRPHLNREVTEILACDIEAACEYLEQHGGTATPPKLHEAHKTSAKC
jgi:hypothetical protein